MKAKNFTVFHKNKKQKNIFKNALGFGVPKP